MAQELRPLRIKKGYNHSHLKYGVEEELHAGTAKYDVLVFEITEDGNTWSNVIVPSELLSLFLIIQLNWSADDALPISEAYIFVADGDADKTVKVLQDVLIPVHENINEYARLTRTMVKTQIEISRADSV